MTDCECHCESGSHESCCGYADGRSPDCPTHGDGSGPNAVRQPFSSLQRPKKTLPEALDAAQTGEEFGQVLQGLFSFLEKARDEEEGR